MPKTEVTKIATLTGHHDCVYTLEQGLREGTFFSAAGDGQVVQWGTAGADSGELVAQVERSVYAIRLLPEKELLLVGHNFNGLHIIDLKVRRLLQSVPLPPVAIFDIAWHRQSGRVFVALADGSLAVLNDRDFAVQQVVKVSAKSLRALALHPGGHELAIASSDHHLHVLDAHTLKLRHRLPGHTNSVFAVAYSPDGRHLLSGGRDAHLRVWDAAGTYTELQAIVAHMFTLNHICYRPDGKYFATCSMDKSVKVWDAANFRLLKVIDKARHAGHGTSVNKLFWPGHQNRLVSCSDDRTISVWEVNFGLRYEDHTA